jgi:AraC-like DNA-binding protein
VIYLEHIPAPPLRRFVRIVWYARTPQPRHARERILPTGHTQVILNLARDFLMDCREGQPEQRSAPSAVVGARTIYEIVDTSDMADLIGVVFEPGGFPLFAGDAADLFSNRSVSLEDVWSLRARGLHDRLRELQTPEERLQCLEAFLASFCVAGLKSEAQKSHVVMPAIEFALHRFRQDACVASVREVAREVGWSERRFSQVFREQVGLTPKVWCRVQRFQRVVRQLHAGVEIPWPELALECGYYDQSHFANEFRAFSGIDATTYTRLRGTPWANHVAAE